VTVCGLRHINFTVLPPQQGAAREAEQNDPYPGLMSQLPHALPSTLANACNLLLIYAGIVLQDTRMGLRQVINSRARSNKQHGA